MKPFQHTRKFLSTLTLAFVVTITMVLGAAFYQQAWAIDSSSNPSNMTHEQTILAAASWEGRAGAMGKNMQGKAQEAKGNITGDPKDQAAGRAKQVEGQARNAAEDLKDSGASLQERMGATAKNVQGKIQGAVGDITGDPTDQVAGKAKQVEGNVRNTVQDVKDKT